MLYLIQFRLSMRLLNLEWLVICSLQSLCLSVDQIDIFKYTPYRCFNQFCSWLWRSREEWVGSKTKHRSLSGITNVPKFGYPQFGMFLDLQSVRTFVICSYHANVLYKYTKNSIDPFWSLSFNNFKLEPSRQLWVVFTCYFFSSKDIIEHVPCFYR